MARILNLEAYPLATTISDDSYLVGTDVTDNKETKNFKIEDLKTHILPAPLTEGIFGNATVTVNADGQISSVAAGSTTGFLLTTNFTSGPATLIGNTLNIPEYPGTLQGVLDAGSTATISTPFMITSDDGTDISEFTFDANTGFELKYVDKLQLDHSQSIKIFDNEISLDLSDTAGGVNFSFLHLNHGSDVEMMYEGDNGAGAGLGNSSIKLERDKATFQLTNTLGSASLVLNPTTLKATGRFEIDDDTNSIGAGYNDDYSILGISTYGNRWIPDAGWVNTQLAGIGSISANIVPVMNSGGTAYVDSPIEYNGGQVNIGDNVDIFSGGSALTVTATANQTGTSNLDGLKVIATNDGTSSVSPTGNVRVINATIKLVNGTRTIPNVFGIHLQNSVTESSITVDNLYQMYLGTTGSVTKGSGEFYGIRQAATNVINRFSGQLQLNYTAGTAGQFLKSADTSGNVEWSAISASDVTGVVTATTGVAQRLAVFDGTDSIEGDANLTYTGSTLKVKSNNALQPNNFSSITGNYLASQVETDDANCLLYGYGTNNSGELILASARGTIATPTAVQSGDSIGEVQGFGHTGTGFRQGGRMLFLAGENYQEGTNYGTTFSLRLIPNGSTSAVTRYTIDGDGNHTFNGNVKVDGQAYSAIQTSTYTPTAAFQIDWDLGNVAIVDLGSASTTPIQVGFLNLKPGANYFIKVIQHATTPVNLTFPSAGTGATKFPGGTAPTISTGANAVDGIALTCISTNELLANFSQDYQ